MEAVEKIGYVEEYILSDVSDLYKVIEGHTGGETIQLKFQLPHMGEYLDVAIDPLGNVSVTDKHYEGLIYLHKNELTIKRIKCYLGIREIQEDVKDNVIRMV